MGIIKVLIQGIGFLAMLCAFISFQKNTHKGILAFQCTANALFFLHYYFLGATTGAILNAVAMVRAVIFYFKDKKWADNIFWLWFFCAVSIAVGIFTWEDSLLSLLPMLGMVCTTIGFWVKNPKYVRIVSFPSSPLWLIYNLLKNSYAGAVCEAFNIISIIVGYIRHDLKKAAEKGVKNDI